MKKKIIIAALCLIAVAGTAVYILTQADTADETIALNDIQVEATVDPEPTIETEPEAEIEPIPEPEPEKTYTQEEANIFFGIVDGSIENSGEVSESDLDDFIDWLDTHLEEAETLEQNYIDTLVEAEEEEAEQVVEAVVEAPVATTPTTTTPSSSGSSSGTTTTTTTVTTPTVTETPSTSSSNGGLAGLEGYNPGNLTDEEKAQSDANSANGDFSIKLQ